MAKSQNDRLESGSRRESVYRGRRIEVVRATADDRAAGRRGASKLLVDGQEIEFEETEDGVTSHHNMFKVYSSPFELAEDMIKQWGEREIRPADRPDHPHHDPDQDHHDHDHEGGHGHDTEPRSSESGGGRRRARATSGPREPRSPKRR